MAAAKVEALSNDALGWARTDAQGALALRLPEGAYEMKVSSLGRGESTVRFEVPLDEALRVELPAAGVVRAHISGEAGLPIPCKVQFMGKGAAADPFFGPDNGEFGIHNAYYSHDGRFAQALEPGEYDVIISRGPEYDAVFTSITVARGEETPLRATLVRSVDTSGWISGDFHNHASPSGDNISSQLGRVLNLVCENIEFAPCTEHNRLDSYVPHLRKLGIEHELATCVGIELTSIPGSYNHHNAFPLRPVYHTQDNNAPIPSLDPEVQIARLALWDNNSDKLVQQNHPDMPTIFFDKDRDGAEDGGFSRMFGYIDAIEVHPPEAIYWEPLVDRRAPRRRGDEKPRNTMATWLQLWNLGRGVPGTVNTDAHFNFHGSGWVRNYIESPVDEPARIDVMDVVHAVEAGRVMMSTGPFLELEVRAAGTADAPSTPGGTIVGAKVQARIRVQCANWLDVDRVDLLVNGRRRADLIFTRGEHGDLFKDGVVKFDHVIELELEEDAHLVAATIGIESTLGPVMGPDGVKQRPVALTNPVFIDIDGQGFKPNADELGLPLIPQS